ncbi:MAG TPA: McrC family protein [Candidatus Mediterraneibacter cottocaccae]|nr:McrC family protein [Candidatus Mediterraneibacter cottocaccae]
MKADLICGLTDWSRDCERKIPRGTAAAKNMNGVSPDEMGLYLDSRGNYHTSGTVGAGWLKDYAGKPVVDPKSGNRKAVLITPRFQLSPWDMLVKVMNDPEYELYTSGGDGEFFQVKTGEDLIPVNAAENGGEILAAVSCIKECEMVCRKFIRRRMDFEEANLNGRIVGNIKVSEHIRRNLAQGREDRVYCRYPVFTVDTTGNRIMKAALKKSKRILRENGIAMQEISRLSRYCENVLKDVRTVSVARSDFAKVNLTGFDSCYKKVMALAKTVLSGAGTGDLYHDEAEGVRYVVPYTINMERLFEFYVRSSIKEYLKKTPGTEIFLDPYRTPRNNPLLTLKDQDPQAYLMKNYIPDIALKKRRGGEERYVAVFDVKYQNSTSDVCAQTRRQNSHQLLFYALLLNVKKCGFIFPGKKTEKQDGKRMEIRELNIQPGDAMDRERREYSQWVVELSPSRETKFAERILDYVQKS